MTVLELMERAGYLQSPKKVMAWIQDALDEIQTKEGDQTTRTTFSVEEDTRYYTLPTGILTEPGVFGKYDSTKWVAIPRIQKNEMLEDSSASTTTSDSDIIMV